MSAVIEPDVTKKQRGMSTYQLLKKYWKKLGLKGRIFNYSSKPLWVVRGNDGDAIAYLLHPMTASPPQVDIDGFRRLDGNPIGGHDSWWKIYDGSSIEIANARPVFPSSGKPYIRTRRDRELFNNIEAKG